MKSKGEVWKNVAESGFYEKNEGLAKKTGEKFCGYIEKCYLCTR